MIYKKLVYLGDSITEGFGDEKAIGWAGRISQTLNVSDTDTSWSVSNLGAGGDTIIDGKHRLSTILLNYPTHLLMSFGTNDMSRIMWPDNQGSKISLAYAKQVWLQLLGFAKNAGLKTTVIGTLPVQEEKFPFVFTQWDEKDKGFFFRNEDQLAYNAMLKSVCTRLDIPMIDLFDDWNRRDLNELLCDGLHPNAAGYDLMADQIGHALKYNRFFD